MRGKVNCIASGELLYYLSNFCDREIKNVGGRIPHRQKDLLNFPKLSQYRIKGSLKLKNKCNKLESDVHSALKPSMYMSQHSPPLFPN